MGASWWVEGGIKDVDLLRRVEGSGVGNGAEELDRGGRGGEGLEGLAERLEERLGGSGGHFRLWVSAFLCML